LLALAAAASAGPKLKQHGKAAEASALDAYLAEVEARGATGASQASPGSLYSPTGRLADAFRDPRAARVDDIVTILISDSASAVTSGSTNTARSSSVAAGITSLGGVLSATGALPNLAGANGNQKLQGQGTTSRNNTLTTTLSARVTHQLPNGNLVVEGVKEIIVNSEKQQVSVRGIIRPQDLSPANTITSLRLANLEVRVNGKGVVNDSVRRPFWLYRIVLGLLPF